MIGHQPQRPEGVVDIPPEELTPPSGRSAMAMPNWAVAVKLDRNDVVWIDNVIQNAKREEREACAELVETAALNDCAEFRARVASEIRARKEEKET